MSLFENISFLNEGKQADDYRARKAKEAAEDKKTEDNRFERRYGRNFTVDDDNVSTFNRLVGAKYSPEYQKKNPDKKITDKQREQDIDRSERSSDAVSYGERYRNIYGAGFTDKDIEDFEDKLNNGEINKLSDITNEKDKKLIQSAQIMQIEDTANRHLRRHPKLMKEEYGLFESVDF